MTSKQFLLGQKILSVLFYVLIFVSLLISVAYYFNRFSNLILFLILFLILILSIFLYLHPEWGLYHLLILLPFHAFLLMVIRKNFSLDATGSFWVAFWKELIIVLLFLIVVTKTIIRRKLPFNFLLLDWLIIILFGLGVLSAFYGTKNFSQTIWGLRTDFEFFLVYFLARSILKTKKQLKISIFLFLLSGLLVNLFCLLQIYYWPPDFLLRFGYIKEQWVPGGPLQAYQMVEGSLIRIVGTLSGAIQLGAYLAVLILFFLSLFKIVRSNLLRLGLGVIVLSFLPSLYHTFTRSAWLGLLGALVVWGILIFWNWLKKFKPKTRIVMFLFSSLILVFIPILITFLLIKFTHPQNNRLIDNLIYHGASTKEHWQSITESIRIIKKYPFGLGIGKSGLSTLRFNERFLSENWYLQIATEMGILALVIFILIMITFLKRIFLIYQKSKDNFIHAFSLGVFLSFICFSIVGLFLHAWGDNTTLALSFWILAGGLIEAENYCF